MAKRARIARLNESIEGFARGLKQANMPLTPKQKLILARIEVEFLNREPADYELGDYLYKARVEMREAGENELTERQRDLFAYRLVWLRDGVPLDENGDPAKWEEDELAHRQADEMSLAHEVYEGHLEWEEAVAKPRRNRGK